MKSTRQPQLAADFQRRMRSGGYGAVERTSTCVALGYRYYRYYMWTRAARWTAILGLLPLLCASVPQPSDWVPARWPWSEAKSLELLADSPVNCLLLKTYSADFVAAAAKRGLVTLAVVSPGVDAVAAARNALGAKVNGIVMEGDLDRKSVV